MVGHARFLTSYGTPKGTISDTNLARHMTLSPCMFCPLTRSFVPSHDCAHDTYVEFDGHRNSTNQPTLYFCYLWISHKDPNSYQIVVRVLKRNGRSKLFVASARKPPNSYSRKDHSFYHVVCIYMQNSEPWPYLSWSSHGFFSHLVTVSGFSPLPFHSPFTHIVFRCRLQFWEYQCRKLCP